jgi:hypothetical protein
MGAQDLLVALLALGAGAWLYVRSRRRSRAGVCPGCNACPAAKAAGTAVVTPPRAADAGSLLQIEGGPER